MSFQCSVTAETDRGFLSRTTMDGFWQLGTLQRYWEHHCTEIWERLSFPYGQNQPVNTNREFTGGLQHHQWCFWWPGCVLVFRCCKCLITWGPSVKRVFSDNEKSGGLRKTSFKVCSCVGFVLHWFQRMLININHLVLRHLTKAYNHATTSAVSDWEVPRLSRVLRVRSPLFASWEVETSCILKFERKERICEVLYKIVSSSLP